MHRDIIQSGTYSWCSSWTCWMAKWFLRSLNLTSFLFLWFVIMRNFFVICLIF